MADEARNVEILKAAYKSWSDTLGASATMSQDGDLFYRENPVRLVGAGRRAEAHITSPNTAAAMP